MNDERARRVGRNEALYRQVNERIEDLNEAFGPITGEFSIICECGDLECAEQLSVPRQVYEQVRANPTSFILAPGHEAAGLEHAVDHRGDYVIVEKEQGVPERLAEESDPRS